VQEIYAPVETAIVEEKPHVVTAEEAPVTAEQPPKAIVSE